MIIPAAMNIYSGADALNKMSLRWREDQLKELEFAMGNLQSNYGIPVPNERTFQQGYELGLAVARVIVAGSAEVMRKQANPENIL